MPNPKTKSDKEVAQFLARNSRKRAKRLGIEHTITWQDIEIPSHCPITGRELVRALGQWHNNSYTLDRIDPSKGYVPGNVKVLSWCANRAKSDLTIDQLEKLIKYLRGN